MTLSDWLSLVLTAIPAALVGFGFWWVERKLTKLDEKRTKAQQEQDKRTQEAERIREQHQVLLVESVGAAIALGEATARAVQRIPDAHCNGDMKQALNYAAEMKYKQKKFLTEQGIHSIYDED